MWVTRAPVRGDKRLQGVQKVASRGVTEPKVTQRYATVVNSGQFYKPVLGFPSIIGRCPFSALAGLAVQQLYRTVYFIIDNKSKNDILYLVTHSTEIWLASNYSKKLSLSICSRSWLITKFQSYFWRKYSEGIGFPLRLCSILRKVHNGTKLYGCLWATNNKWKLWLWLKEVDYDFDNVDCYWYHWGIQIHFRPQSLSLIKLA